MQRLTARYTRVAVAATAAMVTAAAAAAALPAHASVQRAPSATTEHVAAAVAGPSGFFTIQFGRTQFVSTDKLCKELPNSVNLLRVASLMKDRGKAGVGNVVLSRHGVSRSCFLNYVQQPSWNDLTQLRTQYGWTMVSAGMDYQNMTGLTPDQQRAESCGSIGALARRGHTRAWGLFAYPNNRSSETIQRQVVSKCFAFGRKYGLTGTVKADATTFPNWQQTISVNGGRCADTTLACSTGTERTYLTPDKLVPLTKPLSGTWTTMQWYRFVTGTSSLGTFAKWNCTGPASSHWTSDAELYCISDFLRVIDAIPSTVSVTDPATVAERWGVPAGTRG